MLLYIGFNYTWGKGYQRSLLLTIDKSIDGEEYANNLKPIPFIRDIFSAALSTATAGSIETTQSDESTELINLLIAQIPSVRAVMGSITKNIWEETRPARKLLVTSLASSESIVFYGPTSYGFDLMVQLSLMVQYKNSQLQ